MARLCSFTSLLVSAYVVLGCTQGHPLAPTPLAGVAGSLTPPVAATDVEEPGAVPTNGASKADVIRIIHGSIATEAFEGSTSLRGTHGFRLEAGLIEGVTPYMACPPAAPGCQPGDAISLDAVWVGISVVGTGRLQGQTLSFGSVADVCGIELKPGASIVAPAQAAAATLTTPFTFAGLLLCPDTGRIDLSGAGMATASLAWDEFTASWRVSAVTYDFGHGR